MPKLMGSWWAGLGGGLGALGACSIPVALLQKRTETTEQDVFREDSQQGQTVPKVNASNVSIAVQPSAQNPARPRCLKQASFGGLGPLYRLW